MVRCRRDASRKGAYKRGRCLDGKPCDSSPIKPTSKKPEHQICPRPNFQTTLPPSINHHHHRAPKMHFSTITILPLALLLGISAAIPSPQPSASYAGSLEQRQDPALEPGPEIVPDVDSFGNPIEASIVARARADKRWTDEELAVIEECHLDCILSGGNEEGCICECLYQGICPGKGKKGKKRNVERLV